MLYMFTLLNSICMSKDYPGAAITRVGKLGRTISDEFNTKHNHVMLKCSDRAWFTKHNLVFVIS